MQNNTFSTLFVGQNLVKLQEVNSTNSYLKQLLSNSKPLTEGTVIMAENQYAGRGQHHNQWISEPGKNLICSIYLSPSFLAVENQFYLNMAISLGINDSVCKLLGEKTSIKWPNDIYYDDKKIGGILIENTLQGKYLKESIIGIGINVNQLDFKGLINASSVSKILQKNYSVSHLLTDICSHIEARYLQLRAKQFKILHKAYLTNLYRYNQTAIYGKPNGSNFKGMITNVEPGGKLILTINDKNEAFDLKEIIFAVNI